MQRPRLSASIITFNEADRVGDCLASLAFCDEIVVVDSCSTDGTQALCRAAGARVIERPFPGYRSQKQFAAGQCTHDWILSVDADERVSDALRASIEAERDAGFPRANGYRFARLSNYFGKFLRHGNAYPNRVLRLFDRRKGGWRHPREVHEGLSVDGKVVRLDGDLIHYPYRSLMNQLEKTERYARMMAEYELSRGKRASLVKLVFSPAARFLRGYVLRRGFLDGWEGLIYAYVRANYVRQKTIMLWLLQNGRPVETPRPADTPSGAAPTSSS